MLVAMTRALGRTVGWRGATAMARPQASHAFHSAVSAATAAAAAAPTPWAPAAAGRRVSAAAVAAVQRRSFAAAAAAQEEAPKAALMIIGDEVLAGSITDANTPWLAKLLHSRGVDLVRVEYVPDDKRDIVETVLRLRQRVGERGYVFTSGGIGPTHDDITYEAIAAAFGCHLELHQPTVQRMREHYDARGVELNEARLRMAKLPKDDGVEVLYTPGLWVPLVDLRGVYILPGIPRLFQQMIEAHVDRFRGPAAHEQAVYTNMGEGDLAVPLGNVAALHPKVRIGSYPNPDMGLGDPVGGHAYKVKLQLESRDRAALDKAVEAVRQALDTFSLPAGAA